MPTQNLLTALVLMLNMSFSYGQVGKGSFLVGGLAGVDYELQDNNNRLSIQFLPQLGYFATDNIAVGTAFSLVFTTQDQVKANQFGLAPFGRYYFGKSKIRPYAHAQFGYISGATKYKGQKLKDKGYQLYAGPGLAYFLNENLAIEGILGYTLQGGDYEYENFGLAIGFQAYLGR